MLLEFAQRTTPSDLDRIGRCQVFSVVVDKAGLSEHDIWTKFHHPGARQGGVGRAHPVRENVYLTKGRVIVRGKLLSRGTANGPLRRA